MSKRCTRCLKWKERSEFHRDRTKSDGLKSQCKDCRKVYKQEYRARLKARALAQFRRTATSPRLPKSGRRPHHTLSDNFLRWREKNQARRRAYLAAYLRQWHTQHKAASRVWYQNRPEERVVRRQSQRADSAGVTVNALNGEEWKWLLDVYGQRCAYCGKRIKNLTPDHVTPLAQGGHNALSNIVPACQACNVRKGARTPDEADMGFAVQVNVVEQLKQLVLL
jgi:5-methylcytosine-specific restriction endonuclease McrA